MHDDNTTMDNILYICTHFTVCTPASDNERPSTKYNQVNLDRDINRLQYHIWVNIVALLDYNNYHHTFTCRYSVAGNFQISLGAHKQSTRGITL